MKKILLIITTLLGVYNLTAQVLYTENFNNYPVGNIGTDYNGTVSGVGGWFTKSVNVPIYNTPLTNNDYKIVAEANKGNVAQIGPLTKKGEANRTLFRTDLNTYWQQRTAGNNVFKCSFDLYVDDSYISSTPPSDPIRIILYSKEGGLTRFSYEPRYHRFGAGFDFSRGNFNRGSGEAVLVSPGTPLQPPPMGSWITVEMYIDYDNNKAYFSIPTLNYTNVKNIAFTLELGGLDTEGNPLPDDSPVELVFFYTKSGDVDGTFYTPKIDNINLVAQNTVPTLATTEQLAAKFNLYPNPASNVVNITNAENMQIQQITVYDVAGKQLSTQTYNNETDIQLNVEHLASGTYMLHLQTNQGTAVKKLVKK
ncbi:T9SS type A sorting domain-containing protein [Flavobacterium sp. N2155]|uniref:T9SS type A sorting domain-containing protein n=1 Tax=Flavobacterium sp. N2155 TaxID=2986830 RepID=UPI0022244006|nr:T9SS type A sorting domain-containing protein [Flavobacterium sp. N2155]